MSNFQILEDVENYQRTHHHKKKKTIDLQKCHVAEKKFGAENRAVLQPFNNGARQDAKRAKLNTEDKILEVICIDDSLKENKKKPPKIVDELLKIDKHEQEQVTKKEESGCALSKRLLYVAEYRQDIWKYLHELEQAYPFPKSKYMLKQSDLTWNTRSILVDWLSSVSAEYGMCHETFHLSINYIDRFLSHIAVVRSKFQLVGAAAMLLAGKMEEIYPIDIKEWSYLTGDAFTPRQIKKMEQLIAKVLKFRMQPPTTCTFIEHFCHEHNLEPKTMHLAMYISELVLLEGEEYLNYLPSKIAAASIATARYTISKEKPWPKVLREHSGYTIEQLSPVVQKQLQIFKDSPLREQQAIQTKYKSDKYHKVALLKPRNLVLEDFEEEEDEE